MTKSELRRVDRWSNEMGITIEQDGDGTWKWSDETGEVREGFGSLEECEAGVFEVHGPLDDEEEEYADYGELDDRSEFADPGGKSALRAETKDNPRNLPCPSCGEPNRLTPADKARGYQCDACADEVERGGPF